MPSLPPALLAWLAAATLLAADPWTLATAHPIALAPEAWTGDATASASDGALAIAVQPGDGWRILRGPAIDLPAAGPDVGVRRLRLDARVWAEGIPDRGVQLRCARLGGDRSGWVRALQPRSTWDAVAEMVDARTWTPWSAVSGLGEPGNGAASIRPEIWIRPGTGTGRLRLASLALTVLDPREHRFASTAQGHIFAAERGLLTVRWAEPAAIASARIVLRDEHGAVRGEMPRPAGAATQAIILERGWHAVQAEAAYADGRTLATRTSAAVVGAAPDEGRRLRSRLGIMRNHASEAQLLVSGARWEWGFWSLEHWQRGGDGGLRDGDPQRPVSANRARIARAAAMEGRLPPWLRPASSRPGDLHPPTDWDAFARLVEAWARDCRDLPEVLTVYNEPNAHWRGGRDDYVRFHREVARAVKRARPGTAVYGPCMYRIEMAELQRDAAAGILDDLDGVCIHAYVDGEAPEGAFIERIIALRAWLDAGGRAAWPIHITEFGWTTHAGPGEWQRPVDELTRARYVTRSLALAASERIASIHYFVLKYAQGDAPGGYHLLNRDDTPTPGYAAFATACRWLAGIGADGTWLRLTPTANLVLFARDDGPVAVAWDTAGGGRLPPLRVLAAADSMGRPLDPGALPAIGPDPVYLHLAGDEPIAALRRLDVQQVLPGARLPLAAAPRWLPPGLHAVDGGIAIRRDAAPGMATVLLADGDGRLAALPLRIPAPLALGEPALTVAGGGGPGMAVELTANLPGPLAVDIESSAGGATRRWRESLPGNGRTTRLALALPDTGLGLPLSGRVAVLGPDGARDERTWQVQLLAAGRAATPVPAAAWIPHPDAAAGAGLAARLACAWDARGLHLELDADDPRQDAPADAAGMWRTQSVQIAVDADADRPWEPNNVGNGFNGHRVTEHGVGLDADGRILTWRWRADAPGLVGGRPEPRIEAAGERRPGGIRYRVLLPWAVLGLAAAPAPGATIGLAVAVNGAAPDGRRRCLRLGGGIVDGKDPARYARLWLR